jgi:hypothetical protein
MCVKTKNKINFNNIFLIFVDGQNYFNFISLASVPLIVPNLTLEKTKNIIEQKLIGCLLGDGWLEKKSMKSNTRFRYEQSIKHKARFYFTYKYFALFCSSNAILRERLDKRTNKIYGTLHFSTRALPFFNPFYELFYVNNIKVIPNSIGSLLTEIGLAQWIMDDGSFKSGLTLQTNAYTNTDVDLLISVIYNNFGIKSYMRLERNQPIIYIPADQIELLRSLVIPLMEPSTFYKLGL